jgi:7,8-dihydroneopterin aldolase/epimerase/oxygenase
LPTPVHDLRTTACAAMRVFVRGLKIDAYIGVHAHEKGRAQPLIVDVEIELADPRVDRLSDTIDYETVVEAARAVAASGHVDLVEEYAERLARACLSNPLARRVRVRIDKPQALPGAEAAGCEAVFERG